MPETFYLVNPVATSLIITDPFNAPRAYANRKHEGVDLRAFVNGRRIAVLAAQRGTIDFIRRTNPGTGYGIYIRLRHSWPDGFTWITWYGHLTSIETNLNVGDFVQAGQKLGIAGATGNTNSIHLHLTLQHIGRGLKGYVLDDVVDPTPFFQLNLPVPGFNELSFVGDVTVPDGTFIRAGQAFNKQWLIRNTGTATWGAGYRLAFHGDHQMSGPNSISLPALAPNQSATLTLPLIAPSEPGLHRSTWQGQDSNGRFFPFELYAEIQVFGIPKSDDSAFLSDVTIPNGTLIPPGQPFLKTWRIRNTGSATWDNSYTLGFFSDNQLNAPSAVAIPFTRPGQEANVSTTLTAPATAGPSRSTWRLRNQRGEFFGEQLFADILVTDPITTTPRDGATFIDDVTINSGTRVQPEQRLNKIWRLRNTGNTTWGSDYRLAFVAGNQMKAPAAVPLPPARPGDIVDMGITLTAPIPSGLHHATWQLQNPQGQPFGDLFQTAIEVIDLSQQDNARFVRDVTIADGSQIQAGQMFQKSWRIRNVGTSAWNPGYVLAFATDNQMGSPNTIPLPAALPGQEVDVTLSLTAPTLPGTHKSTWRPQNIQGTFFGDFVFAEIRVPATAPATGIDNARLEQHETIPNGTIMQPGQRFSKRWAIRNVGTTTWETGYSLAFAGDDQMGGPDSVAVGYTEPQRVVRTTVELTAPTLPGSYISRWRLRNPQGMLFGSALFVSIQVAEAPNTVDLLPYLRGDGRLYEMKHIFQTGTGQQRVQTQTSSNRFFTVKNQEWEELWADGRFIYRGTDTSPGEDNFYTLSENGQHGSPWIPRRMSTEMPPFQRSPLVTSRKKRTCEVNLNRSGIHVTWIKLEVIHASFRLPDVEGRANRGLMVRDVAVLAAFQNTAAGVAAERPFERYYYAQKYGLVMWEGIDVDHRGISFMVEEHPSGARPNNVRETIPCLG